MKALVLFVLLAASTGAFAQSNNAAYLEVGGNGLILSANYERRLTDHVAGRIGFFTVEGEDSNGGTQLTFAFPVVVSYITHPLANHHLEVGGGVLFVTGDAQDFELDDSDESISNVALSGLVGYRYQKPVDGFVFRAGVTPFFYDGEITPWAGVSFGWAW